MRERGALPTFFVIGAAKAGTTSLHHYLSLHPQIQMSAIKEPGYFAGPDERRSAPEHVPGRCAGDAGARPATGGDPSVVDSSRPFPKGRITRLEDYEALFDPSVAVRGESSPNYAFHPVRPGVPQRIEQLVPDAKFIYLVRDPVERTISHHQHVVALGHEHRPLATVLGDLSRPEAIPETCMSFYGAQLERYLACFERERVLVVDHAELRSDREHVLREVFTFLSVDVSFHSPHFADELYRASERRQYPPGYEQIVGHTLASRLHWVPRGLRRAARGSLERLLFRRLEQPAVEEPLRERLRALYREDVERLRVLTGRRFSSWSV